MRKTIFLIVCSLSNFCFLLAQGVWMRKADFAGNTRVSMVGFCIGTKCYMGTGIMAGGRTPYKDFWEWDSSTNTWTQKRDLQGSARSGAVAFSIGNKGYIATGDSGGTSLNDLWEYDPINDTWTKKAILPGAARSEAVVFTIGTKAYIGIGGGNSVMYDDLWEWDQTTDIWTKKANYPGGKRIDAIAFSIGNKGYIGTGSDGNNSTKDFWEWDQGTNVWTRKADFPFPMYNLTSFAIGPKAYAGISCDNDTSKSGKLWRWDPFTNVWIFSSRLPGTPCGDIGFSNGIKAYVGIGGGYWQHDFWEFDPSRTTGINEMPLISGLRVFPNPSNGSINVVYTTNETGSLHFTIKNTLGQSVYTEDDAHFSGEYNKAIDLGNNPKGIYFVEVTCGKDRRISKIVLE